MVFVNIIQLMYVVKSQDVQIELRKIVECEKLATKGELIFTEIQVKLIIRHSYERCLFISVSASFEVS